MWRNKWRWFEAQQGGDKLLWDDHWQCQNNYCTQTYIYFDIILGSQRSSNGTIKIWSVVMPQTPSQAWCCVGLHLLVKQHHLWVLEGVKVGLHVQDMTGSRCLLCVRNTRNITSMVGYGCFTVLCREVMCQIILHSSDVHMPSGQESARGSLDSPHASVGLGLPWLCRWSYLGYPDAEDPPAICFSLVGVVTCQVQFISCLLPRPLSVKHNAQSSSRGCELSRAAEQF